MKDGFIDDNSYDDYDPQKVDKKKRKRKRISVEEDQLDADDIDLVNESKNDKGKRKRIKKNREKLKEEVDGLKYEDEESEQDPDLLQRELMDKHNSQKGLFKAIFEDSDDEDEDEEVKLEEEKSKDNFQLRTNAGMGIFGDDRWRNEVIRVDIPERLYIRLKERLNPTTQELTAEARWIFHSKKIWKG